MLVVGAGLAGLACARTLAGAGLVPLVLEAGDGVGGRVRSDELDGFRLDRGFQILLTAYPECRATLDYAALDLRPFRPGALVRVGGRFARVADPFRAPLDALASLLGGVGTLLDKARVLALRADVRRASVEELLARPESTTQAALERRGFSPAMVAAFFRPLLGGILLDLELQASSRMLEFVFRMLSLGDNALPAAGMGAIPAQLAAGLSAGALRLGSRVRSVRGDGVELESGERLEARAVVVAADGPSAAVLLGLPAPESRAVTCLYFDAPEPPLDEPLLVLNGEGRGPVTNLCVPSRVAPGYAPAGRHLVSATVIGDPALDDGQLESAVRRQMEEWFGISVRAWRHLRTYRIRHAQPGQRPGVLEPAQRPVRRGPGLYAAGDWLDTASIQGALQSGRRAAEAVIADLGR